MELPISFSDVGPLLEGCGYDVTIGTHDITAHIAYTVKECINEKEIVLQDTGDYKVRKHKDPIIHQPWPSFTTASESNERSQWLVLFRPILSQKVMIFAWPYVYFRTWCNNTSLPNAQFIVLPHWGNMSQAHMLTHLLYWHRANYTDTVPKSSEKKTGNKCVSFTVITQFLYTDTGPTSYVSWFILHPEYHASRDHTHF